MMSSLFRNGMSVYDTSVLNMIHIIYLDLILYHNLRKLEWQQKLSVPEH